MNRVRKISLVFVALLLGIVVLSGLVAFLFDWNHAKPWLSQRISEATGRSFAINGDLALAWRVPETQDHGWRSKIPWPHFTANQVVMGNPSWADTATNAATHMAKIDVLEFSLSPLALLSRQITIPTVILKNADLTLQRKADGRNNWTLKPSDKKSDWQLELGRLQLDDARIRLLDELRRADLKLQLNSLTPAEAGGSDYRLRWLVNGKLENESVQGSGRAGALLALRENEQPYPLDAKLQVGKTSLSVIGTVTRPRSLGAVDVLLKISGPSMAMLFPITSVLFPDTPPYSTQGRLKGEINEKGGNWLYQNFTGKVGQTDIAGDLEYLADKPRSRLKAKLESKLVRFEDLGPLIGKDKTSSKPNKTSTPSGRVLPQRAFASDRWKSLDAEVSFTGHRIIGAYKLPLENLRAELRLQNGVLSLMPLRFGMAGGTLDSQIKMDGSKQPMQGEMKIAARQLKLKNLFPGVSEMKGSIGDLNGDANLTGSGNTLAALLGSASGEVRALIDRGTISKFVLEAMGLNIGSLVVTSLFGDKQVKINCMVSDFTLDKGLMKTRSFVVDTEDAIITIDGSIDLAKEELRLLVNPESRGLRLFSLRSPIYVTGSFSKPQVNIDRGVMAAKAGSAVALGVLAPVATALLPLINAGEGQQSGCAQLLQQARQRPLASNGKSGAAQSSAK